ncbi:hypothetical protein BWQ96_00048 [Gracilariopsis chorda]|uniref:Uncharacterized protein n=1 Tax=Gracilariopsis chorda TaxID=448386 RepID=A0A2V3J636_9FLOR|nr:hypothetical protein BWQ96_00048 [Gracilariopsis chorda]|eukprot:PXF49888.1 hypothetical protein BWQ96_00048 [Gracilariopsis chorda]
MEELIHGVCRLFLMRTECEILVQQSSLKENAFAEYVTKLLIFEVVSGQLFTTLKDFVWISRMQLSQIVIEPTLSPIVQFIEAYKITGLLVNESHLYHFSRPGWFRNATGWIQNVAAKQKLNIGSIEQVSSKAEGCVLRGVNTNGTVVYFKHIGPLADNDEIQASLLLSETMPQYFMRPIDINIEKNWILMHNQGKSLP